jgi:release factor glutamine methyltransferase
VSEEAVSVARANASRHALEIRVVLGDLFTPLPADLRGRVDVVVSNPPYVTPEEYASLPEDVRAEPYEALVGGTDLHGRLAEEAPSWLRPGGWLVVEIGAAQGEEIRDLLGRRFEAVEVLTDLAGRDRVVRGRLHA